MDDRTKTAHRNAGQAAATAEDTIQDAQAQYGRAVESISELNSKLVEMVRANAEAAVEAATQIAKAKNPADLAQTWSTYATRQFATLTDQAKELTMVWQKFFVPPR